MNILVFNACMALGWVFASAGAMVINFGAGLFASGLLLIVLTLVMARVAGGVFAASAAERD